MSLLTHALLLIRGEMAVTDSNRCVIWPGFKDRDGYGKAWTGGTMRGAHRVVYEEIVGPIPDGFTLDHLCRNRGCVRPSHLRPMTQRENVLVGAGPCAINARKTVCSRGHELNDENTYHRKTGKRNCRVCSREDERRYRLEAKGSADGGGEPKRHRTRLQDVVLGRRTA